MQLPMLLYRRVSDACLSTRVCARAGATACARERVGVGLRECARVCLHVCVSESVSARVCVRLRLRVSV